MKNIIAKTLVGMTMALLPMTMLAQGSTSISGPKHRQNTTTTTPAKPRQQAAPVQHRQQTTPATPRQQTAPAQSQRRQTAPKPRVNQGTSDDNSLNENRERIERQNREEAQRREMYDIDEFDVCRARRVDLGLSICWAGYNLGASRPEEYGEYFSWGETSKKDDYSNLSSWRRPSGNISPFSQNDVAFVKWGAGWRMPTKAEFEELMDRCIWRAITYRGVYGYRVTGPNNNSIFIPAAGYYDGRSRRESGSMGCYWSSTNYAQYPDYSYFLRFKPEGWCVYMYYGYYGQTVRPVCK